MRGMGSPLFEMLGGKGRMPAWDGCCMGEDESCPARDQGGEGCCGRGKVDP